MKNVFLASAAVLMIAATPALAQYGKKAATKGTSDQQFVTDVAHVGQAEVELGKMAADKASSDQVKKFGQRMADEHAKAGDELKAVAEKSSMTWPTGLDPKHQALHDRLMKLSGEAFDRAYMQEMVAGHRAAVNELKTESKNGKNPEIQAWATKTLPTIEDHLKQAQEVSRGVVGTTGTKK